MGSKMLHVLQLPQGSKLKKKLPIYLYGNMALVGCGVVVLICTQQSSINTCLISH